MVKNGFFRTRRFAHSEQGSVELFGEDRGGMDSGGEGEGNDEASSQAEAKRRKDRLEREEFMKKCRVSKIGLAKLCSAIA